MALRARYFRSSYGGQGCKEEKNQKEDRNKFYHEVHEVHEEDREKRTGENLIADPRSILFCSFLFFCFPDGYKILTQKAVYYLEHRNSGKGEITIWKAGKQEKWR